MRESIKDTIRLAYIDIPESKIDSFVEDIEKILNYFHSIDVKSGTSLKAEDEKQFNVFREDRVDSEDYTKDILSQVPCVKDNQICVKKILP